MKNNCCVYRHRRLDTNEVFYIGIAGNKYRPYTFKDRTLFWKRIVNKAGYKVEIIAEGLNWDQASELEILLISEYGRRDLGTGTLVNMTDGGEGTLGRIPSQSHREKISNILKGRKLSEDHIEKLKESHLGIKLSEESIIKRTLTRMDLPKRKNTSSSYKGVSWCKRKNKWRATIYVNKKQIHLGYFTTEIEAHNIYSENIKNKKEQLLKSL